MDNKKVAKQGGIRIGAGRPNLTNATSTITIRVTSEQKAKFLALGGAEWLRKTLSKNEK